MRSAGSPRPGGPRRQAQFTDQLVGVGGTGQQLPAGDQDADRDREVEAAALLGQIGGCQVDGDAPCREFETAVQQRAAHAVAAFLHGLFRQADDIEGRQAVGEMGFDADQRRIDAERGPAMRNGE